MKFLRSVVRYSFACELLRRSNADRKPSIGLAQRKRILCSRAEWLILKVLNVTLFCAPERCNFDAEESQKLQILQICTEDSRLFSSSGQAIMLVIWLMAAWNPRSLGVEFSEVATMVSQGVRTQDL